MSMTGSSSPIPKGKKARNSHIFERDPHDWYVEPKRATAQLCTKETFVGAVHDPCCGQGNVVEGLWASGYVRATGSDLICRVGPGAGWYQGDENFLTSRRRRMNLVLNPPYFGGKGAEAFIRHALEVADGKVCAFVNRRFGTGNTRAKGLFHDHRPSRCWEVTPRPSCPPGLFLKAGGKATGDTKDYCWLVWDPEDPKGPDDLMGTGWLT